MRTNIVLTIICLILASAPTMLAQQPDSTTPTDTLHPKILEERIKALDAKIDKIDAERTRELDQRVGNLEGLLNRYFGVAALILAALGWLGIKNVVGWIQQTIKKRTDKLFEDNDKEFKKRAEKEADKLLVKMIEEGRQEFRAALKKERTRFRELRAKQEKLISELPAQIAKVRKPLNDEMAKELSEYTDVLPEAKSEDEYTTEDWFLKGYRAFDNDDQAPAVDFYTRAISVDPNNVMAYNNRSIAFQSLKRYKEALEDANKAIELDPNDADLYFSRGCVFDELERYVEAHKDYSKAIVLDESFANAYYNRAQTLSDLKRREDAIKDYDKVIELEPNDLSTFHNASELCMVMGKNEDALAYAEKAQILSVEHEDLATSLYLKCIAEKLLNRDTHETSKRFEKTLQEDFEISWDFDDIEDWVKTAEIPEDVRKFIVEKTELFKKKKRNKG